MGSGNIDSTGSSAGQGPVDSSDSVTGGIAAPDAERPGPPGGGTPAALMAVIEAQRRRLLKIAAVVAVCSYACTSDRANIDSDVLADALDIVCELMDQVTEALEGPAERIAAAHSVRDGDREHQPG